jgi:glycerol-3-phosphate O-acyltransferase 3/4
MLMTSWAIVCNIWYLPPIQRRVDESAIDFAKRVKNEITKVSGLDNIPWDGQVKRMQPKNEWKEKQQEEFTKRLGQFEI